MAYKRPNMDTPVTKEVLRSKFRYWPITGNFTRIGKRANWRTRLYADSLNAVGYKTICIFNRNQLSHRMAWIYLYGEIPDGMEIDHINGDRGDNRLENLRLATRVQNSINTRVSSRNKTGYKGVCEVGGKFLAQFRKPGKKSSYIGAFDSPELAYAAYTQTVDSFYDGFRRKEE